MKAKMFNKVIASVLALLMTFYSLEMAGVLAAYASEEKEQIDLLECVPKDAEMRYHHIEHLDQYDTEDMVVYLNDDGTTTFYIFQSDIRYKDENGDLQLYDNTLIEVEDTATLNEGYKYKSKSSDVDILFPEHLQGTEGVKIKKGEYSLEMLPVPLLYEGVDIIGEESTPDVTLTPEPTLIPATETPTLEPTPTILPSSTPDLTATPTPMPSEDPTETPEVSPSPETSDENSSASVGKTNIHTNDYVLYEETKGENNEDMVWGTYSPKDDVENKYKAKIKDEDKEKKDRKAEYISVENDDITYSYSATDTGIKENIVINSYSGQYQFDFVFIAPNLKVNIIDNRLIEFRDQKTDEIVFISDNFYAVDSYVGDYIEGEGHFNDEVKADLIASKKDEYRIRITVPKEFLEDERTVYPITVDPSYGLYNNQVIDTFINSLAPTTKYYNDTYMYMGQGTGSTIRIARCLVKFDMTNFLNLHVLGSQITSATYSLYNQSTYTSNFYLRPYKLSVSFVSTDVYWNNFPYTGYGTWNNREYLINHSGWYNINITEMFTDWVLYQQLGSAYGSPYYGFLMRERDDTYDRLRLFSTAQASSNRPYIVIQYNNETLPPSNVSAQSLSSSGTPDSGECTLTYTWNGTTDEPIGYDSGVDKYEIYLSTDGTNYSKVGEADHTGTGTHTFNVTGQADNTTYYGKILPVDNFGNKKPLSQISSTGSETAGDYTSPTAPTSVTVSPSNNTNNDETPTVSWTGIVKEPTTETLTVQYSVNSTAEEDFVAIGSSDASGSGTVTLPDNGTPGEYDDGTYTIYIRAIDNSGNTGAHSSVNYNLDKTEPVVALTQPIDEQTIGNLVDISGTVTEVNPVSWTLYYGEGYSPSTFTEITSGTTTISGLITQWDASVLQDGNNQLKLYAIDEAGNENESIIDIIKADDAITTPSQLTVTNPIEEQIVTAYTPMTVTYEESTNPGNILTNGELFIDGYLIDDDDSDGLTVDFLASGYEEILDDGLHYLYVKAQDTSDGDEIKYSSTSYDTTLFDSFEDNTLVSLTGTVFDGTNELIRLQDNSGVYDSTGEVMTHFSTSPEIDPVPGRVETVILDVQENKPGDTNITYDISPDHGENWIIGVIPNTEIDVTAYQSKLLLLRANLSPSSDQTQTPELLAWELKVHHVNAGQTFTTQLVAAPTDISVMSYVNYKTLIRWEDSINPTGTKYNVYRFKLEGGESTPEGAKGLEGVLNLNEAIHFTKEQGELVAEGLEETFFYDFNLDYGQIYSYKVSAVRNFGSTETPIFRESVLSLNTYGAMVDSEEFIKRFGLQDYWKYAGFSTGSGTGYIEVSKGNLCYQTTDFVYPGPLLAMVMRRTYNSLATSKTALGQGFDFSFNTALMMEYDTSGEEVGIILKDGDGTIHRFEAYDDSGVTRYNSPDGVFMDLTHQEADATNPELWLIDRKDGIQYVFDRTMKIIEINERNGNYIAFSYDARGNIDLIENNAGDEIVLDYYDTSDPGNSLGRWNDLVKTVTDPSGRVFNYNYLTDEVRLANVKLSIESSGIYEEEFVYDAGNDYIIGIKDGEDILTSISYDTAHRVERVTTPVSDTVDEYFDMDYLIAVDDQLYTDVTTKQNKVTTFEYESNGTVTSVIDPLMNSVEYTYNTDRQVTSMSYENIVNGGATPETITYTYAYNTEGDLETVTDPYSHTTIYDYEDALSNYNPFNKPYEVTTQIRSGVTATTSYTYDAYGNVDTITDADNETVTRTYHDGTISFAGLLKETSDRYDNVTKYSYNSHGWLVNIDRYLDSSNYVRTTISEYDDMGNPIKAVDAEGNVTKYDYDILGRQIKTYIADDTPAVWTDNDTVTTTYDLSNNIDVITDSRNNTTDYDYDYLGRVVMITKDDGNPATNDEWTTNYSYDVSNNLQITNTDPEGMVSVETYDAAGRLDTVDSGGAIVEYDYDNIGNVISVEDGEGREAVIKYDKLNRVLEEIVDPTGENMSTSYEYDYVGNTLSITNGEGDEIEYVYDILGRLDLISQDVTMDVGGVPTVVTTTTDYEYDDVETIGGIDYIINTVEDAENGLKKTYLDPLGRIYKEVDEGTNTVDSERMATTHTYDDNGRVTYTLYNDGTDVDYDYNERGLLERIEYDDTSGEEDYTDFTYDANGNLLSATGEREGVSIATSYSYNVFNQIQTRTENGNTISYEYYDNGQLKKIKYPVAPDTPGTLHELLYEYNSDGQLVNVKFNGDTVESYTYDAAGYVDTVTTQLDFNSAETDYVTKTYTYNTAGLLEQILYEDDAATPNILEQYDYEYDDNGMITDETLYTNYSSAVTITKEHSYDEIGRLVQSITTEGSAVTTSYDYDKVGNRVEMSNGTDTYEYAYSQFKELLQVDKNTVKELSYTYDDVGRTTQESQWESGDETLRTAYNYNDAGELGSIDIELDPFDGSNKATESYYYNYQGQRIRKEEDNGYKTDYYYSGSMQIYTAESLTDDLLTQNIVTPGGRIIASQRYDNDSPVGWYFYNYDIRQSTTTILNEDYGVEKSYKYDEFGNTVESGSLLNEIAYTSAVSDSNTGLYYMNSRYYNPNVGRFLTQDSYKGNAYDPWTQHLYSYVGNNPVNMVDPTGHYASFLQPRNQKVKVVTDTGTKNPPITDTSDSENNSGNNGLGTIISNWIKKVIDDFNGPDYTEDEENLIDDVTQPLTHEDFPMIKVYLSEDGVEDLVQNHRPFDVFFKMADNGMRDFKDTYGQEFPLSRSTVAFEIGVHYYGGKIFKNVPTLYEHFQDADIYLGDKNPFKNNTDFKSKLKSCLEYTVFGYWLPWNSSKKYDYGADENP